MSGRAGLVYRCDRLAGLLEETEVGFQFTYDAEYLRDPSSRPVSLTLPKQSEPFFSKYLFPCFVALLAEGALAQAQCQQLRLDEEDYFGRLLKTCAGDCIGSLRVLERVS